MQEPLMRLGARLQHWDEGIVALTGDSGASNAQVKHLSSLGGGGRGDDGPFLAPRCVLGDVGAYFGAAEPECEEGLKNHLSERPAGTLPPPPKLKGEREGKSLRRRRDSTVKVLEERCTKVMMEGWDHEESSLFETRLQSSFIGLFYLLSLQ
ncbi:hypothetical protein GOP47_0008911 [Adiantum capillus-veneris]|uniref:Uncharacterized protein n=1 Tax=Adiantum capillus-veneris TaxID=13818 RepID=A0A9D4UZ81_ADICA|nr:hypothetical protein GOP47_0008911 [Adiantum capillus-veneris]